jgi:carotenoid cleavage dioxygenase
VVLDAQAIDKGPIATAELPRRVPFGFHGNWAPVSGS